MYVLVGHLKRAENHDFRTAIGKAVTQAPFDDLRCKKGAVSVAADAEWSANLAFARLEESRKNEILCFSMLLQATFNIPLGLNTR